MAKAKKTAKTKKAEKIVKNEVDTNQQINLTQAKKFEDCEWCFQFDEDEPQIFAWTDPHLNQNEDPKIIFTITNLENSFISFTNPNKKAFKIFSRELSEQGEALRNKQREALKNFNADVKNLDQKMEEYGSENKEA